jgi:outer membrane protein assembly factor BamB
VNKYFVGKQPVISLRSFVFVVITFVCAASATFAGDWPQILGPARNGIAVNEQLAASWRDAGPKLVWQREVGAGLAGVAVVGDEVYLFHRVGNEEVIEKLSAATGEPRWKRGFPAQFDGGFHGDAGPRCVPTVVGDRVFLLGAAGDLHCVAAGDGAPLWSRSLSEDYDAPLGYFGVGSCPIVAGDRLLVNVGGKRGAGLAAFSLATGETLWKGTDEGASYSAPTLATIGGQSRAIFVTRLNVVGIVPESGEVVFRFPFGKSGPTVNAATPLVFDDLLFVSASYGVGATAAKLETNRAQPLWQRDDVMSSQYVTCIHRDGYLYGVDGRQDVGVARLRCFDPKTGEVKWTVEGFGVASLLLAGDKAIALKTDGQAVLFRPNPERFEPLVEAKLFDDTAQALPALSNGRFFARDTKQLKCFEVGSVKK